MVVNFIGYNFMCSGIEYHERSQVRGYLCSKIRCFNEDYVNDIAFRPNELVSNSFDIFVKNDDYKKLEHEIEFIIRNIKTLLSRFYGSKPPPSGGKRL